MTLNLSVDEVLTTTRSVRKRLDFDKPVSRDVLMECLELALQAPTGVERKRRFAPTPMMAVALAMAVPIVIFFLAQRAFMRGVVVTGVEK